MLKLTETALEILKARYLRPGETPEELFERVARSVSQAELLYGPASKAREWEEKFLKLMLNLDFLPNSPTLMNAGTELGQLAACFVLPVEDSIEDIFDTLSLMAKIQKTGGGTGFSFSHLRPKGDIVRTTNGRASGPVSFMKVFDCTTDSIKQGGKRRGANMGVLSYNHPDVEEFVLSKRDRESFQNFNISVACEDSFFEKIEKDEYVELVNPRTGEVWGRIKAGELFNLIAESAWDCGDPGILYIDEINRHNPTPQLGRIEATNPCGEVPLLPYEECNLGSINLSHFEKNGNIDWEKLEETVRIAVRFLDCVIDVNKYPDERIEKMAKGNRKIGLGVMGWAELLIKLGIPYNSERALKLADEVMGFINRKAFETSVELAGEKGSFPNIGRSIYRGKEVRNATRTSIAPTGTISMIAGTTPSIEPLFAIAYIKKILDGKPAVQIDPFFLKYAGDILTDEQVSKVLESGSIQNISDIPEEVRRIFVTALDISPEWHVRMQAVFQRHVDNSVSKTVNLRKEATVEDVKKVFILGHKLKLKGITVFRQGSKEGAIEFGLKGIKPEDLVKYKACSCEL
ncbi:ribonucleoside-diphosphate reductase class II [Balnearium lithotrophicum]|uniref:Vitamin B12-dependent ribonucleotide reductase n=1 Tax=Balnearium lithotrophicum TaxID=223788 RepID=A0A521CYW8_9BACT|nr:adenosylcobalamin-dependent ribonucleoside-diphosphate reductase [Balnearium lithotrophicum]SMO64646.1 ribonucleoside-diphosphate reductase class II [Balnearium lithotrophicum]